MSPPPFWCQKLARSFLSVMTSAAALVRRVYAIPGIPMQTTIISKSGEGQSSKESTPYISNRRMRNAVLGQG
jgi:hypothetical protein